MLFIYFFIGLFLGSFLNVVIERTHLEKPWWKGRSWCDNCKKNLTPLELIPILSFLIQKGKCKNCSTKLSLQYPIVEILSGLIFVFVFYKYGFTSQSVIISIIGLLLLGNFISDLKYMELPEIFSIPTIILSIFYTLVYSDLSAKNLLIGIAIGFMFFFIQYTLTKGKGIGSGDIRLGIIMGALLGWPLILAGLVISYVSGSIISLILLALGKINRKSAVPLGIFLIPGLVVTFIFVEQIKELAETYFRML